MVIAGGVACQAVAKQRPYRQQRAAMVRDQIEARGVTDKRVLRAMRAVPRHLFVPSGLRGRAYDDRPLPIGYRQTISQPYIVAYMTEALGPRSTHKVLEIGTGSGYQAAVLSGLVQKVFTIEIVKPLGLATRGLLRRLGYRNVHVRIGDGYRGWPKHAPFDGILITAAPPRVPQPLVKQLKIGGRLVMPVGTGRQMLIRLTRTATGVKRENLLPVRFVPMTGEVRRRRGPRSPPRARPAGVR
ncbi:MAG: protein-L-isoaspartate(D-aspartate) O-methyltransferase [bacterium]